MQVFTTYKEQKGKHQVNRGLLWEYALDGFDWQKYRRVVAERVIAMGRLSDWYGAFDLYGGIRGFRKETELTKGDAHTVSQRMGQ